MKRSLVFLDIDGVLNTDDHFDRYANNVTDDPTPAENRFIERLKVMKGFRHSNQHKRWLHALRSISTEHVARLNLLFITQPTAEYVLSSTWRFLYDLNIMQEILKYHGFGGSLIDRTSRAVHGNRGKEVLAYVKQHRENIETFIAIDDDPRGFEDMRFHYIQTDPTQGLTLEDVQKAHYALTHPVRTWETLH